MKERKAEKYEWAFVWLATSLQNTVNGKMFLIIHGLLL